MATDTIITAEQEKLIDFTINFWVNALRNNNGNIADAPGTANEISEYSQIFLLATSKTKMYSDEEMAKFASALKNILMTPQKVDWSDKPEYIIDDELGVDYDPTWPLKAAANAAGIKAKFPSKTSTRIKDNCVQTKEGYGAPYMSNYALANNQWLQINLTGPDISLILDWINTSNRPAFKIG